MAGRVRKKILVTGATGFVGSHIVDELLASDLFEVHTLIRKTSSLLYLKDKPVILHYGNILDYNSLLSSLAGIDIIIHSAGLIRARNFHQFYQYNTIGTENLLRAALATKTAQKFIYISTQAASSPSRDGRCICEEDVAHPVSQYGRSKRLAEIVLKQYKDKISVIALRPVAVYGPRDRETLKILQLLKLGFFIRPALKKTTVCLIYVKDLARVCVELIDKQFESGSTYFLSDGNMYEIDCLLRLVGTIIGKQPFIIPLPSSVALFFGVLNESLGFFPFSPEFISRDKIRELSESWICSIEKAKSELDFKPRYSLEEGMRETIDWYRANHWL